MKTEQLKFQIRQEQNTDLQEIYQLIQTAFQTAKVKDGDEQDYAVSLRNSNRYLPELALVAETGGKLIGHIMLTTTKVIRPDESIIEVLLLSPLSVLIEYRSQGVGAALIKEGCKRAVSKGYKAVFLCGDPAYYNRFGFQQTSFYGITAFQSIPEQYVLVKELESGFLNSIEGKVECC